MKRRRIQTARVGGDFANPCRPLRQLSSAIIFLDVAALGAMAHRKTIRRFHEPGHLHELTFTCYGRRPLLNSDTSRAHLAHFIDQAGDAENAKLVAFVFMPEHVHLLVQFLHPTPAIGRYLARIKQPLSKHVKQILAVQQPGLLRELTVRERPGKFCFRFWQEGSGFDRNIFSRRAIEASIDYIHANPVRRGLCERAIDWKWSSAQSYFAGPCGQEDDLPVVYGLPPGAID